MRIILLPLLLGAVQTPQPAAVSAVGASYHTDKSLAVLEACLTHNLAEYGDVTAVTIDNTKTLVYKDRGGPEMMIDLAPPSVTVTTKFATGTRKVIEACL